MRVHHMNCATFCPVGQKLINGRGGLLHSGTLVVHCQLIETARGLVLIDTGLGLRDIIDPRASLPGHTWQMLNRPRLDINETAMRRVEALGFHVDDVRNILLTHLDFDHAGGLPDFPDAFVHVHQVELDAALERRSPKFRYAPAQWAHKPQWVTYSEAGERWFGFEAVRALPGSDDEILFIPLFGHSAGHCGIAFRTETGWFLNAGDAFFHHDEMHGEKRHCPLGLRVYENIFQFDREQRMTNVDRLRQLVKQHSNEVTVFCSHDPDMLKAFQSAPRIDESQVIDPHDLPTSQPQPTFRGVRAADPTRADRNP